MSLFSAARSIEEQVFYLLYLRQVKNGWTRNEHEAYLSWFRRDRAKDHHPAATLKWFSDGGRDYGDGASVNKFMDHIRKDAIASLDNKERTELASLIAAPKVVVKMPASRHFVKEWKVSDILPALEQVSNGRSFQKGKKAFEEAQCLACHRFGNE